MKRRLRALLLAGSLGASAVVLGAAPAVANHCGNYDPAVRVWEAINYGGRSALMCGVGWHRSNFSDWTDSLGWFENWNDRISSYQTYHFSGHRVIFWFDAGYSGGYLYTNTTTGVADLRAYNSNDRFSSGKIDY